MRKEDDTVHVRMDNYTRICLTVIAGLLVVLIAGLWAEHTPTTDFAEAARPTEDKPAASREARILKAQEETAAKVAELVKLLKSGEAQVKIVGGDEGGGKDDSKKLK